MKRRLYHGTTWTNYQKLLTNGFLGTSTSNWHCSQENLFYFYSLEKAFLEFGTVAEAKTYCLENALWSARLAAALEDRFETTLVILEFSIDDTFLLEDPDCDLAVAVEKEDLSFVDIREIHLKEKTYSPSFRLFILREVLGNELLNVVLNPLETKAVLAIENFYYSEECYE